MSVFMQNNLLFWKTKTNTLIAAARHSCVAIVSRWTYWTKADTVSAWKKSNILAVAVICPVN